MPSGDERRVHADHSATDDHDVGGGHARHASEEDAAAAQRLFQHERARLGGDLARHLGHRRQQRQPALAVLHRLVGDAGRSGLHQPAREGLVGGEVQVGEEHVVGLEPLHLNRLRLLDLDDHRGLAEHRVGVGQDRCALRDIGIVGDGRPVAGAALDEHLVPGV